THPTSRRTRTTPSSRSKASTERSREMFPQRRFAQTRCRLHSMSTSTPRFTDITTETQRTRRLLCDLCASVAIRSQRQKPPLPHLNLLPRLISDDRHDGSARKLLCDLCASVANLVQEHWHIHDLGDFRPIRCRVVEAIDIHALF